MTYTTRKDVAREEQIISLFRAGKTMQEVAAQFGVSRERIRQILARNGVRRREGGAFVRSCIRKLSKAVDAWEPAA